MPPMIFRDTKPAVIQVVGYKNTGKTTLVCRLTELLKLASYKVGTIKRDAHDFRMDTPGTDTWKHQAAGADITAISSDSRSAILMNESATLGQLLSNMNSVDIVLVEGFKHESHPKLVLVRNEEDAELLGSLSHVAAVVLWPETTEIAGLTGLLSGIPKYSIDDAEGLLAFILQLAKQR
ncbi:molybdopterin-guanine dinucleotide biosynthesis protein B [Paenibacillus sp. LHD-117]|uniref:molybdopterin-guanine dinucleotide biosynthesis protein B n=1 Tax=Paenibacillus sp. LHD-117 TaxID=3071412 RepID=UPI0027E1C9E2|nr:molybdopterin-guanine dinucleotide biosynthesis protein B [Paenibacillus sp. LHD-117]MDQ6423378.1 molybdopterin-guanine dinucleotide biosynthesis protein B [Paenibacillus sp. LHD-117]